MPQAASRGQPRADLLLELWRLRLEGIHYLGKRQVLRLTISQNPSPWPLCLQRFSTAHLLQLPPTCAEGSTCIMQQVLPPSALDGFSTLFRKKNSSFGRDLDPWSSRNKQCGQWMHSEAARADAKLGHGWRRKRVRFPVPCFKPQWLPGGVAVPREGTQGSLPVPGLTREMLFQCLIYGEEKWL